MINHCDVKTNTIHTNKSATSKPRCLCQLSANDDRCPWCQVSQTSERRQGGEGRLLEKCILKKTLANFNPSYKLMQLFNYLFNSLKLFPPWQNWKKNYFNSNEDYSAPYQNNVEVSKLKNIYFGSKTTLAFNNSTQQTSTRPKGSKRLKKTCQPQRSRAKYL